MNGMHQDQGLYFKMGSDDFTASNDYELPPNATCAQITLGQFFEYDGISQVELGFTNCSYLDENGVTRAETFPEIDSFDAVQVFAKNGLVRAECAIRISNIAALYVVNFFFWDAVS